MAYPKYGNHNYNKILKSDWLSTALISVLIRQYLFFFIASKKNRGISCVLILKRALYIIEL